MECDQVLSHVGNVDELLDSLGHAIHRATYREDPGKVGVLAASQFDLQSKAGERCSELMGGKMYELVARAFSQRQLALELPDRGDIEERHHDGGWISTGRRDLLGEANEDDNLTPTMPQELDRPHVLALSCLRNRIVFARNATTTRVGHVEAGIEPERVTYGHADRLGSDESDCCAIGEEDQALERVGDENRRSHGVQRGFAPSMLASRRHSPRNVSTPKGERKRPCDQFTERTSSGDHCPAGTRGELQQGRDERCRARRADRRWARRSVGRSPASAR